MIISGGIAVKAPDTVRWTGSPSTWPASLQLGTRWASYSAIYRSQVWVRTVIDKRALLLARLPLKVYRHDDLNRPEVPEHPYARLLAKPNERQSQFSFWLAMQTTFDIYGEAFAGKLRDDNGRPYQLIPMHPTAMQDREENGHILWDFDNGKVSMKGIPDEDLFHPRNYNPDSYTRGLSKLESLRATLENEDAALRAQSSFWRNGARPGVALTHPNIISQAAADRLRLSWEAVSSGADNYGRTVILEEGMKPEVLSLSAEEAQYIEARRLNREEVIAAYDIPPPAVHDLTRATFSNITAQLRSVYRDTIAPLTVFYESELETQVRGSSRREATGGSDFGEEVYAEFLLDGVLRGDFEDRAEAYQKAINSGWQTPAEVRKMENLPFIEGSDRLFINSTMIPVSADEEPDASVAARNLVEMVQKVYLGVDVVITADEARGMLNAAGANLGKFDDRAEPDDGIDEVTLNALMGRLSRPRTLNEIDRRTLIHGLNGNTKAVLRELDAAVAADEGVMGLRERIKQLAGKEA